MTFNHNVYPPLEQKRTEISHREGKQLAQPGLSTARIKKIVVTLGVAASQILKFSLTVKNKI